MRSAVTLTAMVAGGYWDELAMHVKAARRNGLSVDEIKEILLQTAIYCSVPAANVAFQTAKKLWPSTPPKKSRPVFSRLARVSR